MHWMEIWWTSARAKHLVSSAPTTASSFADRFDGKGFFAHSPVVHRTSTPEIVAAFLAFPMVTKKVVKHAYIIDIK
ncbi:MAG: hypothetical protein Rhims3KO_31840 [Hyphomicrobiales bacterium]